jgi:hypothetical protein
MKKTLLASFLSLSIFMALAVALPVLAQTPGSGDSGGVAGSGNGGGTGGNGTSAGDPIKIKLDNPFRVGGNLFDLLKTIVNELVIPLGGLLCVLAFIYSGFMYVTSQGNPGKIKTASTALLYAAVGTVLLLGSWVFAQVIGNTVNKLL